MIFLLAHTEVCKEVHLKYLIFGYLQKDTLQCFGSVMLLVGTKNK